jgi:hypothetical protein
VRVEIIPATFRDLSYIASRMRADDRAEAEAQIGPFHSMDLAAAHLRDVALVALLDGNPEAAFGASRFMGNHLWNAWSWGSPKIGRCAPAITRHVRDVLVPDLIGMGAWRVEARALASHRTARNWLRRMGATERCILPSYGRGGEDFFLYDWTKYSIR